MVINNSSSRKLILQRLSLASFRSHLGPAAQQRPGCKDEKNINDGSGVREDGQSHTQLLKRVFSQPPHPWVHGLSCLPPQCTPLRLASDPKALRTFPPELWRRTSSTLISLDHWFLHLPPQNMSTFLQTSLQSHPPRLGWAKGSDVGPDGPVCLSL